jgi:hypothetical protein
MSPRLTAVLPLSLVCLLLVPAGATLGSTGIEPRAGVSLDGSIHFPRRQAMTLAVDDRDTSRARASLGFDGTCRGGGLGEFWASNVPARESVRIRNGKFTAKLTGTTHDVGVKGRDGTFHWTFKGRFIDRQTAVATVRGSAELRSGRHVVARCKIADPATVRLTVGG